MSVSPRTRPPLATADDGAGQTAFAALYDAYSDPIYWYCRSRLGDVTAAEDAASTVFSHALAAGPRYDDPSLRSWLFSIAHNVVANLVRATRPAVPLGAIGDLPDPLPLPEETVLVEDERDRLLLALQRLPETQRQVITLRMVGLTGVEIARTLGCSNGAVKMLQRRAFQALRAALGDDSGAQRNES